MSGSASGRTIDRRELRAWLDDPIERRNLWRWAEPLLGWSFTDPPADDMFAERLAWACERAGITVIDTPDPLAARSIAVRSERLLGVPLASLSEAPAEHELSIALLDSEGRPFDVDVEIALPEASLSAHRLSDGRLRLASPIEGRCTIRFSGFDEPLPLPTEAGPTDRRTSAHPIALDGSIAYTRWTDDTPHVFQLVREIAEVIEVEHFGPDSSVLVPGYVSSVREDVPQVTGIDALRFVAAELRARGSSRASIIGHGSSSALARARAENLACLLGRDEDGWVANVQRFPGAADFEFLRWTAETRHWRCDPLQRDAVRTFKQEFAHECGRRRSNGWPAPEPGPVDDVFDEAAWRACFHLVQWTLEPEPGPPPLPYLVVNDKTQTYPVLLSRIATGDERNYRDLYPINPGREKPGDLGWLPLYVGDVVFLPRDPKWDLAKLRARGYDVFEPPAPAAEPPLDELPPIVDTADRHIVTPDAEGRRGLERAVEVVFGSQARPRCCSEETCNTTTDALYDPSRTMLAHLPVPHRRLEAPDHAEFFVYPEDGDSASATANLDATWGSALRLGWLVVGDLERVELGDPTGSTWVDVTAWTTERVDDHALGGVPICVPVEAAPDGVAIYRLRVTWTGGRRDDSLTVRIGMVGAPPELRTWYLAGLVGIEDPYRLGLGSPYVHESPSERGGGPLLAFGIAEPVGDKPKGPSVLPTDQWPANAAAPDILSFQPTGKNFRTDFISSVDRRRIFASMAMRLCPLGKGVTVDGQTVPGRPNAYLDSLAMGEPPAVRRAFLGSTEHASSCQMFVRSLFKMVGIGHPSYETPFVFGAFHEWSLSQSVHAERRPGQLDGAGAARYPQMGDAVYINKLEEGSNKEAARHMFVIVSEPEFVMIERKDRKVLDRLEFVVAQGGQASDSRFPGDGGCMGSRVARVTMKIWSSTSWQIGEKYVRWWIDIDKMADACDKPFVMPVRGPSFVP